ncbi:hypothetical protein V8C86DRAFT_3101386 [Haematococcus lacustris]
MCYKHTAWAAKASSTPSASSCQQLQLHGQHGETVKASPPAVAPPTPTTHWVRCLALAAASSGIRNGLHCTDLVEDGPLEVAYFFTILQN